LDGTQHTGLSSLGQCLGNLTHRWEASALSWEQMGEKVQGKLLRRSKEARDGYLPGRSLGPQMAVQAGVGGGSEGFKRKPVSLENWGSFAAAPSSLLVLLVGPQSVLPPAWRLPRRQNGANMIREVWPLPPGPGGDPVWRRWPPPLLPTLRQM